MEKVDKMKSFTFKNAATVFAYSIDEAKEYLKSILTIDNNIEKLREENSRKPFNERKLYWNIYTDNDIESISEQDYNKGFTYINEDELLEEDMPYIYDTKPGHIPPLVSLPTSKARKYNSYREMMNKIEVPSISWWTI